MVKLEVASLPKYARFLVQKVVVVAMVSSDSLPDPSLLVDILLHSWRFTPGSKFIENIFLPSGPLSLYETNYAAVMNKSPNLVSQDSRFISHPCQVWWQPSPSLARFWGSSIWWSSHLIIGPRSSAGEERKRSYTSLFSYTSLPLTIPWSELIIWPQSICKGAWEMESTWNMWLMLLFLPQLLMMTS